MHVLFTFLEDAAWSHPGHNISREISNASATLTRLGVRITVLTTGPEESCLRRLDRNLVHLPAPLLRVIPVTRLDEMRLEALLQSNLSLLARMASPQLGGEKIDLVHCFGWEAGLASDLICQMTGAPLVCTIQDVIRERTPWLTDPQLAYPRHVERWLIRRCRRLICPDRYMRDKIQDLFLVKDDALAVLPPVPSRIREGDERGLSPKGIGQKILYMGPLGPESGVDDLLWACSQLVSRRAHHLQLFLVTSADPLQDLLARKMIRKLQLAEHVLFLDQIGQQEALGELFRQANLFVMPGKAEFVGNLVLEAMGNGLPVVAANCGALAEIIEDGVNGLKFSFGEGRSLLEAMETVLLDPDLHRRMALGAHQEARGWPEVGPLLLKIYQETCAGPPGPERKGGETDDLLFPESGGGGGV